MNQPKLFLFRIYNQKPIGFLGPYRSEKIEDHHSSYSIFPVLCSIFRIYSLSFYTAIGRQFWSPVVQFFFSPQSIDSSGRLFWISLISVVVRSAIAQNFLCYVWRGLIMCGYQLSSDWKLCATCNFVPQSACYQAMQPLLTMQSIHHSTVFCFPTSTAENLRPKSKITVIHSTQQCTTAPCQKSQLFNSICSWNLAS
jgi:hypothetical protein